MKLITLQEWSSQNFSVPFNIETLNKWARENLISPPAKKIGRRWLVQPNATYIESTIEAQRTEKAQKELGKAMASNIVLNEKLLRIINNDTKAA